MYHSQKTLQFVESLKTEEMATKYATQQYFSQQHLKKLAQDYNTYQKAKATYEKTKNERYAQTEMERIALSLMEHKLLNK